MKLFSLGRTVLAIPSKVWVGGWLIKVLKMVKTMLRMKTLVWYTDVPPGVVFAHSVQSWGDARPASRLITKWTIGYTSSCFDGRENSKNEGDTYVSHPLQHLPRFLRKLSILLSFPRIASKQLPGINTWYKPFNYPTTHPVCRAPRQEKVNFHRLIELNLIDPEKILIFSFK